MYVLCVYVCMYVLCVYVCVCVSVWNPHDDYGRTIWVSDTGLNQESTNFSQNFGTPQNPGPPKHIPCWGLKNVRRHGRKFDRFGVCTALSLRVTSVGILSCPNSVQLAILYYSECLLSWSHCGLSHSVNCAPLIYSFFCLFYVNWY